MIINIRGTNGSGKTTLARKFITDDARKVVLTKAAWPSAKDPDRLKDIVGMLSEVPGLGTVCVVGSYDQAQGGLDTIPNFALQFEAITEAQSLADHVICEGILASTVAGSWLDFFLDRAKTDEVAVCYLDTPMDVCLARIRERQQRAGKERDIKVELVADKIRAIAATKKRFDKDGGTVATYVIDHTGDGGEAFLHQLMSETV